MIFKAFAFLLFISAQCIFGQEAIPKAELKDSSSWKSHDFYIGGGVGSTCYNIELGYWVGGKIFGDRATYFGFGFGDLYKPIREEDNLKISESLLYSAFFEFKYNSGLGFIAGLDFSERTEINKNLEITAPLTSAKDRTVAGPFIGISKVFPNSKTGLKALIGTSREFSLILDLGL